MSGKYDNYCDRESIEYTNTDIAFLPRVPSKFRIFNFPMSMLYESNQNESIEELNAVIDRTDAIAH